MFAPILALPCPRCSYPLRPLSNGRTELEHCNRCGGNFFAAGDMARSFGPEAEPAAWVKSEITHDRGVSKLHCPHGHGAMEAFDLAFAEDHVEVDVCPRCGGLWLDPQEAGQLVQILDEDKAERIRQDEKNARISTYLFQLFTGMPVEVYHPVRRRPAAVMTLMAVLFAIYLGEVFLAVQGDQLFIEEYSLVPARVMEGRQVWGLFTYMFLHGGAAHLLGNLYFLYIFGDNVEDRLHTRNFLILYVVTGLAGGALHLLVDPGSEVPMLGASGAISGVLGAYLVLFPKVRVWVVLFFVRFKVLATLYIVFWFVFQLAMASTGRPGVAWYAHIGGFGVGVLLARLLGPSGWPYLRGERVEVGTGS